MRRMREVHNNLFCQYQYAGNCRKNKKGDHFLKDIYLPDIAIIDDKEEETGDVTTFKIRFRDKNKQDNFDYKPGQFLEVSVFGIGEIPISITSTPTVRGFFELSIKNVGLVSGAMHQLHRGEEIGIRGPFGNGFPCEKAFNKNLLFIGGGIGLAPLRSFINYALDNRDKYIKFSILYGARTPSDLVFKKELDLWAKRSDVETFVTVDRSSQQWQGNVGVVTTLFPKADISVENTMAFVCGPPIMIPFVIQELIKLGFTDESIISTLERHMKCGVGKCGHCCIGEKYICQDGPVFSYKEMKKMVEEV
jgi:sulfhydrogenase subunit gamma (sulfur reductase)